MTLTYIVWGFLREQLKGYCPLPTLSFLLANLWFLGQLQFDLYLYLSICTSVCIAYKIVGFHIFFHLKINENLQQLNLKMSSSVVVL